MRRSTPLYGGKIKARVLGGFTRLGLNFAAIKPGFDAQGRARSNWTQVVYGDTPIWEWKLAAELPDVLAAFDREMAQHIKRNLPLFEKALAQTVSHRRRRFQDGKSGVEPAPVVAIDGRDEGKLYPA